MEPIFLMEHLLVQSYLIQGEFEEFHEKKAAIYLIANHLIQPIISLEMPVPSQGHYGFHSFPVVD
jgi:hypothetical protein